MKFKIGDTVRRIKGDHVGMVVGDIDIVVNVTKYNNSIILKEYRGTGNAQHSVENFELVKENENMKKKFKNKFDVTGPKTLLKAFMEELKAIGHYVEHNYDIESFIIVNDFGQNPASGYNQTASGRNKIYYLPSQWDEALELASEVEKNPFKEGDWCYYNKFCGGEYLFRFKSSNDTRVTTEEFYYINSRGDVDSIAESSDYLLDLEDVELATEEKIKRILTKVAEIKYPAGITVIGLNTEETKLNVNAGKRKKLKGGFGIQSPEGKYKGYRLYDSSNTYLYSLGQWAEIVDQPLIVNGYSVEKVSSNTVVVGCSMYHKKDLENLEEFLRTKGGTYYYADKYWSSDHISKVLEVFNE